MTTPVRFGALAIDTPDPARLAAFYAELLGWREVFRNDDFVALTDGRVGMTFHRVAGHRAPAWPGPDKQMHLDLAVDDVEAAVDRARSLGATVADVQPNAEAWRVLLDPAGHPFCLTALVPDFASISSAD